MADNYVQSSSGTGTTTCAATLVGVTAGNTLVAFLFNGSSNSGGITGVTDVPGGAFTAKGPQPTDVTDFIVGQGFVLTNVASGTHVATGTVAIGNACDIFLVEVLTTAGAASFSGANGQFQAAPGALTDAVSSGSMTVSGSATMIAFSDDNNNPVPGTGFTSRATGNDGIIGFWTLASAAVSANAAGTFTAASGQGGFNYITLAMAILNAPAASIPPGSIYS